MGYEQRDMVSVYLFESCKVPYNFRILGRFFVLFLLFYFVIFFNLKAR